jgi:hypothetical protein
VDDYDPSAALNDLNEEALLPNPVHVRDMILRSKLSPEQALEMNRQFQAYQHAFGEAQRLAREVLAQLAHRAE